MLPPFDRIQMLALHQGLPGRVRLLQQGLKNALFDEDRASRDLQSQAPYYLQRRTELERRLKQSRAEQRRYANRIDRAMFWETWTISWSKKEFQRLQQEEQATFQKLQGLQFLLLAENP